MRRKGRDQRALDEARERTARDRGRYRTALVWLGFLLIGLALAGVLVYCAYRGFSSFFGQIAAGAGG